MVERIKLVDALQSKDRVMLQNLLKGATPQRTQIIFQDHDTGETIGEEENKVVITGSILNACRTFGFNELEQGTPTYNDDMGLDKSVRSEPTTPNLVCLFCVDDSGCGNIATEVYQVNYTDRIDPASIMPFRYVSADDDLSEDLRKYYYGRKTLTDGSGKIAYYFKSFDTDPQLHLRYSDGTQITMDEIYDVDTSQMAECYVEMRLRINRYDFRDYFEQVLGWDAARISSISLASAWYTEEEEDRHTHKYYQDIIPYTKLNFPVNWLVDLTKAIDIIYRIYY